MVENIAAIVEYGPIGLLAVVIVGFFWYVRSVEARAAKREDAAQDRQTKYIEALVNSTTTLAVVITKFEAHDERMQEEHQAIMDSCGDFPGKGLGQ